MTQEDKDLLLKDLCDRLPYGVKCYIEFDDGKIFHERILMPIMIQYFQSYEFMQFKPFLRPLSSMTEEEKVQLSQYACIGEDLNGEFIDEVQRKDCAAYIDWLNRNHFDYRGLIEKGLAIVVNENNNPYK